MKEQNKSSIEAGADARQGSKAEPYKEEAHDHVHEIDQRERRVRDCATCSSRKRLLVFTSFWSVSSKKTAQDSWSFRFISDF